MYARAVWVEHGKEVEGTAPDNWIDVDKKTIRWPKKGVKAAFLNQHAPKDDWMTFTLVKRKITSGVIIKAPSFPIPPTKVTKSIQIESAGSSKNFTDTGHSNSAMSHHVQSALSKYRSTGNPGHSNVNPASQPRGAGPSHQPSD
ncbi:hypothetical protein DPEC_G00213930, partial [Dallia pectoralis]